MPKTSRKIHTQRSMQPLQRAPVMQAKPPLWPALIALGITALLTAIVWNADHARTMHTRDQLAREQEIEKAAIDSVYLKLYAMQERLETKYDAMRRQKSQVNLGQVEKRSYQQLQNQIVTFEKAIAEKQQMLQNLQALLEQQYERERRAAEARQPAAAEQKGEAAEEATTATSRIDAQWFGMQNLGTAFPEKELPPGRPFDLMVERFLFNESQQGRVEELKQRREADLKAWHERNETIVERLETKIAEAKEVKNKAAEREARQELARVMNWRDNLMVRWEKELMAQLNVDQRRIWFAERIWAILEAEIFEFLTQEQIERAREIAWKHAAGETGFFEGAIIDENDLRVKNALAAVKMQLMDVDQRQTHRDTVRRRNVAARRGETEAEASATDDEINNATDTSGN